MKKCKRSTISSVDTIKLQNVVVSYVNRKGERNYAANNITFDIAQSELVCILGPSGSGKFTILNVIAGIIKQESGNVYFDDLEITDLEPYNRNIGFVFQEHSLYSNMSVF